MPPLILRFSRIFISLIFPVLFSSVKSINSVIAVIWYHHCEFLPAKYIRTFPVCWHGYGLLLLQWRGSMLHVSSQKRKYKPLIRSCSRYIDAGLPQLYEAGEILLMSPVFLFMFRRCPFFFIIIKDVKWVTRKQTLNYIFEHLPTTINHLRDYRRPPAVCVRGAFSLEPIKHLYCDRILVLN